MTLPKEASLPSIYDYLTHAEVIDLIKRTTEAMTWVAIIVCAYLILEWVNDNNDNDPDGYA